jgi:hypothetical protein
MQFSAKDYLLSVRYSMYKRDLNQAKGISTVVFQAPLPFSLKHTQYMYIFYKM